MSYEQLRELLQMNSAQIVENTKMIKENFELIKEGQKEHNREMQEIRKLFKDLLKRIAV